MSERPDAAVVHRRPTIIEAFTPLVVMAALIGGGYGWLHYRIEVLLFTAAAVAGAVAWRIGYSWAEMERGIVTELSRAMPAIFILIAVGALVATWIAAGTIPMLIYYGLQLISPRFFLVSACMICSIVSVCTGTSWGTIGTMGVALMAVASGLGVQPGAAAGAIVAGAYFGDKISPFSDQSVLAAAVVGANLFDHIRWLLWTTLPAWILGLGVYLTVGYGSPPVPPPDLSTMQAAIRAAFGFSPILLLPPALILWFVVARLPTVPGLLLSSAAAAVLAILWQGRGVREIVDVVITGYRSSTGIAELDTLLMRGGMASMMEVALLIFAAFAFAGIMLHCGLFTLVLELLLRGSTRPCRLVSITVLTTVVTGLITGSSHLCIMIPGQLFAPAFRAGGLAAKNLSRTTEDSGTVVVPLIPWSASGVFIAASLGVPTASYALWAVMNYAGMGFALLYAVTGLAIAPRVRENEALPGS